MVEDLAVGCLRQAEAPLIRRGRRCARRGALAARLWLWGGAGEEEESTGVSRIAGDLVDDEYPPVRRGQCPNPACQWEGVGESG